MKGRHTILGIDPGTRVTGYGVIKISGHSFIPLDFGCIRPSSKLSLYKRCLVIHESIDSLLSSFAVDAISIESQFFSKNAQSALKLGMAKGVAILAATKRGISTYEYTPRKAKLAVVGKEG